MLNLDYSSFFPGWIMQMCRFLYIDQRWKSDEERLGDMIDHLASIYAKQSIKSFDNSHQDNRNRNSSNFQIVLFPEGTSITETSKAKSNEFADKTNLKRLNHVLHPRTTGFSFIASKMREGKDF